MGETVRDDPPPRKLREITLQYLSLDLYPGPYGGIPREVSPAPLLPEQVINRGAGDGRPQSLDLLAGVLASDVRLDRVHRPVTDIAWEGFR